MNQNKTTKYLKYAKGEILMVVITKTVSCPVRDKLLVERINTKSKPRAFRYEIYDVPHGTLNNTKRIATHIKSLMGQNKIELT